MTGLTLALVDRGIRSLSSLPQSSSSNSSELSRPSRFVAAIRGIVDITCSQQARSPKDTFGFRVKDGGLGHRERYPGFTYETMVHQSKVVVPRLAGSRSSRLAIDSPGATAVAASSSSEGAGVETITLFAGWSTSKAELEVLCVAVATVLLATANKILYKMALVPMKDYPFFLAQLTTFRYVLVYFSVLYGRYKAGIVTEDMLNLPKGQFVALGALEALGLATGMAAAAVLPAASIPVLLQVFLVWQLILSAAFLGKRYTTGQIAGCLLVVAGVIMVVASGGGTESLQRTGMFWPVVMTMSALFSAGGSILKESVFKNAKRDVKGGNVDLFVVNSFGSGFQALFVLLLLPLLSHMRGIPFHQLGSYFRDGSACFFNAGSSVGCEGSPFVPLLYVVANMTFNVSSLYLMKISSAILSSLSSTASVPLAIFAFTLPLPFVGAPPTSPSKLLLGSAILCTGLALYNISNPKVEGKLDSSTPAGAAQEVAAVPSNSQLAIHANCAHSQPTLIVQIAHCSLQIRIAHC